MWKCWNTNNLSNTRIYYQPPYYYSLFCMVFYATQWSASSSFYERVKFDLFGVHTFLTSQAWVFFTFEIQIESILSILKLKTQLQVITILLWKYQAQVKLELFWVFTSHLFEENWEYFLFCYLCLEKSSLMFFGEFV